VSRAAPPTAATGHTGTKVNSTATKVAKIVVLNQFDAITVYHRRKQENEQAGFAKAQTLGYY
jgi:hypothetical protein